ncbi:MAG: hypothetical protein Q7W56_07205 [Candidatus Latescibacteria bacterium]|nr:hypothetical protein [Candidatus Latescibacterota bacterium]
MKKILFLTTALILVAGVAAAGPMAFGVRGGYVDAGDGGFFAGGHVKGLNITPEIALVPNVEVAFFDGFKLFSFAADANYSFVEADLNGFIPYAGGELGLHMFKWDDAPPGFDDSYTKMGISILGGLEKSLDETKSLMFELKIGLSDYAPDMKFTVGLTFF